MNLFDFGKSRHNRFVFLILCVLLILSGGCRVGAKDTEKTEKGISVDKEVSKKNPQQLFRENGHWIITMVNAKTKGDVSLKCEVASTDRQKMVGLMFRTSLPKDRCMIFVYDRPQLMSFWMKSTAIPLSIAFVSEHHTILEMYDMQPYDQSVLTSNTPALYAIEVNRGWFKNNSVFNSSRIRIEKRPAEPLPSE